MERYVGLDVSLKLTAICIVDQTGKIVREGMVPSDPEAIAAFIQSHAPHVARVGLETGATATWLWSELKELGLPSLFGGLRSSAFRPSTFPMFDVTCGSLLLFGISSRALP
jgi:hypothetical protein